jgi:hypothetical protein
MKPKPNIVRPNYTGELDEPIYEPINAIGLLGDVGGVLKAQAIERATQRQISKLEKLCDEYEIARNHENRWFALAYALAVAHVPGMRVAFDSPLKPGPEARWQSELGPKLVSDVETILAQAQRKMSYKKAIQLLLEDKSKGWSTYTLENLITRHREARRLELEQKRVAEEMRQRFPGDPFGRPVRDTDEKT